MNQKMSEEEKRSFLNRCRSKYISEIHFYLVNAQGCSDTQANQIIEGNMSSIDDWLSDLDGRRSDRDMEPAVNAVVAARILAR